MAEYDIQVAGRLTAHEFLIEILYARAFVDPSDAFTEELFRQLKDRARHGYTLPEARAEGGDVRAISAECARVIDRFCEKVRDRRDNLRDLRSRDR